MKPRCFVWHRGEDTAWGRWAHLCGSVWKAPWKECRQSASQDNNYLSVFAWMRKKEKPNCAGVIGVYSYFAGSSWTEARWLASYQVKQATAVQRAITKINLLLLLFYAVNKNLTCGWVCEMSFRCSSDAGCSKSACVKPEFCLRSS